MRDLAQRLLATEAADPSASQPLVHEAVRVCERLRISLTRFAGADGFSSLLRRALALAQAETPALRGLKVNSDGSLEGLEQLAADAKTRGGGGDGGCEAAAIAITANLLALLTTFIGRPLTLRLVRDAWPNAPLDELQ